MIEYPRYLTLPQDYIKMKLDEFLFEDAPAGDITSNAIIASDSLSIAQIEAESDFIFAGKDIIEAAIRDSGNCETFADDGDIVYAGQLLSKLYGPTNIILRLERTLLNLLQRLCGIATETNKYVKIAEPFDVKILDTRKTTPGLRLFEKYAVAVGGGYNHRLDLSSGILIKDNHIKAASSINAAVKKIKSLKQNLQIEVEIENFHEIEEAILSGADGFLLDNMPPDKVRQAVEQIRSLPNGKFYFIEASGGINLTNLEEYVKTGINAVSVGAITHSVKSAEIHLEIV